MKRLLALICAALASLGVASCSGAVPAAAKVNSTTITRSTLNDDLDALVANKALASQLESSSGEKLRDSKGTINADVTAQWLRNLMIQEIVDHQFSTRKLTIRASDRSQALTSLDQQFGTDKIFKAFPKSFQDRMIVRTARYYAVQGALTKNVKITDTELRQLYDQDKAQICASDKAVAHILVATKAEADAIETQLAQGADFAQLARTKSTDTQSGAQGGALGCLADGTFVQSFQDAANALAVGATSAPVQSQYGWHVIRVTEFTFDDALPQLRSIAQQQSDSNAAQVLMNDLTKAKLWVNPQYGTVKRDPSQGITIAPPKAPSPKSKPAETTTTTLPPASSGSAGNPGGTGGGSSTTTAP